MLTLDHTVFPEGDSFTYRHLLTARLNAPTPAAMTVSYTVTGGSATSGNDYVLSGTLPFAAGNTARSINLDVIGDTALEGDETFTLAFDGAFLIPSEHTVTLAGDDDCPSPNLIVNPSNEQPIVGGNIPGWTKVSGSSWTRSNAFPPFHGSYFFVTGNSNNAELAQTRRGARPQRRRPLADHRRIP